MITDRIDGEEMWENCVDFKTNDSVWNLTDDYKGAFWLAQPLRDCLKNDAENWKFFSSDQLFSVL